MVYIPNARGPDQECRCGLKTRNVAKDDVRSQVRGQSGANRRCREETGGDDGDLVITSLVSISNSTETGIIQILKDDSRQRLLNT